MQNDSVMDCSQKRVSTRRMDRLHLLFKAYKFSDMYVTLSLVSIDLGNGLLLIQTNADTPPLDPM